MDESNWLRASLFLALTPCRDVFRARSRIEREVEEKKKEEIRGKKVEKGRNHGISREKTKLNDVVADVVNFSSFRAGWMERKKRPRERERRWWEKKIINWTRPDPFSHVNSAGEQKWLAEWYSVEDRFLFSPARREDLAHPPTFLLRPLVFHVAFLSFV